MSCLKVRIIDRMKFAYCAINMNCCCNFIILNKLSDCILLIKIKIEQQISNLIFCELTTS